MPHVSTKLKMKCARIDETVLSFWKQNWTNYYHPSESDSGVQHEHGGEWPPFPRGRLLEDVSSLLSEHLGGCLEHAYS